MADKRSVSNIRAMFEAKESSPPSRGRSPAGSEQSGAGSRNVSGIRSGFIAVERSGQSGPMLGIRRVSDVTGGESPSATDRLRPADSVSPGGGHAGNTASRSASLSKVQEEDGGLGTILKGSPFEDRRLSSSTPNISPAKKSLQGARINRLATEKTTTTTTTSKYQVTTTTRDSFSSTTTKPSPISTKLPSGQDKANSKTSKTPTSATRGGPAVKVSSPRTSTGGAGATVAAKKAEPPLLATKKSRTSLSATAPTASSAANQTTRAKSPAMATARKPARQSDVSVVKKQQQPRPSLGASDPAFLSRMMKPTQAYASKLEKEEKTEDKKARPQTTRPSDSSFLERMMKPTQASASKHQDDKPEVERPTTHKSSPARTDSHFLERMMKPTTSFASKHGREEAKEEKPRVSSGNKGPDSSFLERMTKPTASSSIRSSNEPHTEPHMHTSPPAPKAAPRKAPDGDFLDRLTKPTASSAGRNSNEPHIEHHKHETQPQPKPVSHKAPDGDFLNRLMKPTASSAGRSSNEPHVEHHMHDTPASPKPVSHPAPDSGFLDRLTKPTASSTGRTGGAAHVEPHSHADSSTKPKAETVHTSKPKDANGVGDAAVPQAKVEPVLPLKPTEIASEVANESVAPRPEIVAKETTLDEPKAEKKDGEAETLAAAKEVSKTTEPAEPVKMTNEPKTAAPKPAPVQEKEAAEEKKTVEEGTSKKADTEPTHKPAAAPKADEKAEIPATDLPRHEPVKLVSAPEPEKPAAASVEPEKAPEPKKEPEAEKKPETKEEPEAASMADMVKAALVQSGKPAPEKDVAKEGASATATATTTIASVPASAAAKTQVKLDELLDLEEAEVQDSTVAKDAKQAKADGPYSEGGKPASKVVAEGTGEAKKADTTKDPTPAEASASSTAAPATAAAADETSAGEPKKPDPVALPLS